MLLETDTSLAVKARYTDYPGYWGGLASQNRSGVSSFYGFDSQGSTRILVSIGGAVTDNYSYKAFGVELQSGSGTLNPHRYVGRYGYWNDRPNVNYVRARILMALVGAWISRDVVVAGLHNYTYANNCPTAYADPTGADYSAMGAPSADFPGGCIYDDPKPSMSLNCGAAYVSHQPIFAWQSKGAFVQQLKLTYYKVDCMLNVILEPDLPKSGSSWYEGIDYHGYPPHGVTDSRFVPGGDEGTMGVAKLEFVTGLAAAQSIKSPPWGSTPTNEKMFSPHMLITGKLPSNFGLKACARGEVWLEWDCCCKKPWVHGGKTLSHV